jgi:hypothetical protein
MSRQQIYQQYFDEQRAITKSIVEDAARIVHENTAKASKIISDQATESTRIVHENASRIAHEKAADEAKIFGDQAMESARIVRDEMKRQLADRPRLPNGNSPPLDSDDDTDLYDDRSYLDRSDNECYSENEYDSDDTDGTDDTSLIVCPSDCICEGCVSDQEKLNDQHYDECAPRKRQKMTISTEFTLPMNLAESRQAEFIIKNTFYC